MSSEDKAVIAEPIARINSAREAFNSALKSRNQALCELYGVYLDALSHPSVASAIESEYESLPDHPKTKFLTNKIAYIAFSKEKRRVSEVHKILLAAHEAKKSLDEMMNWLAENARSVARASAAGGGGGRKKDNPPHIFAVAEDLFANAYTELSTPPYGHLCQSGEYLIQICQKQRDGTFLSGWVHTKSSDHREFLRVSKHQALKPATYDEMVAKSASLQDAA